MRDSIIMTKYQGFGNDYLVLDAKKGKVRQEFTVKEEKRNREWLYEQGALRREIYKEIMEGKVNV